MKTWKILRDCRLKGDGVHHAIPDPWRGLCRVIERICELHARDRGFTEAFLSTYPGVKDVAAGREYTVKAVAELAQRAKATGHLRSDFVLDDLILILMANKGIHVTSTASQVKASRRFAGLVIQASKPALGTRHYDQRHDWYPRHPHGLSRCIPDLLRQTPYRDHCDLRWAAPAAGAGCTHSLRQFRKMRRA